MNCIFTQIEKRENNLQQLRSTSGFFFLDRATLTYLRRSLPLTDILSYLYLNFVPFKAQVILNASDKTSD